ncbi:MAG: hypothetical protein ACYCTV_07040 [Leptospirales bacterium]
MNVSRIGSAFLALVFLASMGVPAVFAGDYDQNPSGGAGGYAPGQTSGGMNQSVPNSGAMVPSQGSSGNADLQKNQGNSPQGQQQNPSPGTGSNGGSDNGKSDSPSSADQGGGGY